MKAKKEEFFITIGHKIFLASLKIAVNLVTLQKLNIFIIKEYIKKIKIMCNSSIKKAIKNATKCSRQVLILDGND